MNHCPITYEPISVGERYSKHGLKILSPALKNLLDFPYSAQEQRLEAQARSSKLSIQGVQPKLSAKLNIKKSIFEIVDKGGRYIFKPQIENYPNVPENEDLTMRLAATVGIEVPNHGLIYSKDGSLTYFIRRFDRQGQKTKLHVEDFAQLSGENRETKYDSSMEKVATIIETYCTFPVVEKSKLFTRTLFSFLIGNEDMHLKNFSLIVRNERTELSPAYDLLNSSIIIPNPKEELALPIKGRKNHLTEKDLLDYFGGQCLGLSQKTIDDQIHRFKMAIPTWHQIIDKSFLNHEIKQKYEAILSSRTKRLKIKSNES